MMPSSIASFASGAGASSAAVPSTSETSISATRRAVGREQRGEAAQPPAAAARAAQAPAQLGACAAHRPATSRSSGLRVRKTLSGRPFSTISR